MCGVEGILQILQVGRRSKVCWGDMMSKEKTRAQVLFYMCIRVEKEEVRKERKGLCEPRFTWRIEQKGRGIASCLPSPAHAASPIGMRQ